MGLIKVAKPQFSKEELKAVVKVLKSGKLSQGKYVRKFESAFARYCGTNNAVACNSGTAALHLALEAFEWPKNKGYEVIVPAMSFFSTVSAVLHAGLTPVFADVSIEDYCIDIGSIQKMVTSKTVAIIPVHLYGYMAPMGDIMEIAADHSLRVIEDAAQAHGASLYGRMAGSWGDMGCFSFYATKNMTTIEGGMVTCHSLPLTERMQLMRHHGMRGQHSHERLGWNYRMNEVSAVLGVYQLEKLDRWNYQRIKNTNKIFDGIEDLSYVDIKRPESYVKPAYFWAPVISTTVGKDLFTNELKWRGIETRCRYYAPLYRMPALVKEGFDPVRPGLPMAEYITSRVFGLPNHPSMSNREIRKVIKAVRAVRT